MRDKLTRRAIALLAAAFTLYAIAPTGSTESHPQTIVIGGCDKAATHGLCGWQPPHVQRYMPWTTA